jgi:hypothetical protein
MLEDDYAPDNRNMIVPIGLPILLLVVAIVVIVAKRRGR